MECHQCSDYVVPDMPYKVWQRHRAAAAVLVLSRIALLGGCGVHWDATTAMPLTVQKEPLTSLRRAFAADSGYRKQGSCADSACQGDSESPRGACDHGACGGPAALAVQAPVRQLAL
jgi:hypothetical protein